MRKTISFFIFVLSGLSLSASFKKIEVLDTNNNTFAFQNTDHIFSTPDRQYLVLLRKYVESKGFSLSGKKELEAIKKALKWSSSQWEHDGMNQPPKNFRAIDILKKVFDKKERYRCVEYGIVLSELLQAYGFITRTVSLRSNNVAYGGFGQGHVAMEVWSNDLGKWIFLDPQFSTYISYKDEPLNIYEIYKFKKGKKWNKLTVKSPKNISDKNKRQYKDFLEKYLGHMSVSGNDKKMKISLIFENKKPVLTFQGMAAPQYVFTGRHDEIYPQVNRVSYTLEFKNKIKNFQKFTKKLNIKNNEDYLKSMNEFAAIPVFKVKLYNNMPNFSFYEYRLRRGGSWNKLTNDHFDWDALKKKNLLEVRAVNSFARRGPITFLKLAYE